MQCIHAHVHTELPRKQATHTDRHTYIHHTCQNPHIIGVLKSGKPTYRRAYFSRTQIILPYVEISDNLRTKDIRTLTQKTREIQT